MTPQPPASNRKLGVKGAGPRRYRWRGKYIRRCLHDAADVGAVSVLFIRCFKNPVDNSRLNSSLSCLVEPFLAETPGELIFTDLAQTIDFNTGHDSRICFLVFNMF